MNEKFQRREDIPDLVPPELLLPADRVDLRVPQWPHGHTQYTTTPVEVGHYFYTAASWLQAYEIALEGHQSRGEKPEEFLRPNWMNHLGRVVVRVMLDPDRLAPIDMMQAYDNERPYSLFPNDKEWVFFEGFAETHGVLEDRNYERNQASII